MINMAGVKTLYAFLNDHFVGTFERSGRDNITFTYDSAYRWGENATPVSLSLPLSSGVHRGVAVTNYLEALVPESQTAREFVMRLHGAASTQAFDLLAAIGFDVMGALRLTVEPQLPREDDTLEPISDEVIATRLREAAPSGIQPAEKSEHWSIAGQQGKFALVQSQGKWFVSTGSLRTTHIIKPGIPYLPDQAFDEFFTMEIARRMGLPVVETDFRFFEDIPAIVVKRFDRVLENDSNVKALHQEDFTQALGVALTDKYEEYGGPVSSRYVEMLRQYNVYGEAERNVWSFVDGILASYLLGSTDSHAKNFSVLLDSKGVKVAPLYDFASVFPYAAQKIRNTSSTLAMSIGGQRKLLQLRREHLVRFAERNNLDAEVLVERFIQLAKMLPQAFENAEADTAQIVKTLENPHFIDDFEKRLAMTLTDIRTWSTL